MIKTCFGCCPLRHGASGIAIINIIWNLLEILKHSIHRYDHYEKIRLRLKSNTNELDTSNFYDNTTYDDLNDVLPIEEIPVMSGIFMDYIFIMTIGWIVLELISNFFLKQSTFKIAPQKIYVWLVIYYGNLSFMVFHVSHYILLLIKNEEMRNSINSVDNHHFGHFFTKLTYIAIIVVELFIIHSYYIVEKNSMLNDFVQLKWKYVSKGNVVSKGIVYPSTSTFKAETSCQTQGGSRIPPYITNILQD